MESPFSPLLCGALSTSWSLWLLYILVCPSVVFQQGRLNHDRSQAWLRPPGNLLPVIGMEKWLWVVMGLSVRPSGGSSNRTLGVVCS